MVIWALVTLGMATSVTLRQAPAHRELGVRRGVTGRWEALAILWRRWAVRGRSILGVEHHFG